MIASDCSKVVLQRPVAISQGSLCTVRQMQNARNEGLALAVNDYSYLTLEVRTLRCEISQSIDLSGVQHVADVL